MKSHRLFHINNESIQMEILLKIQIHIKILILLTLNNYEKYQFY